MKTIPVTRFDLTPKRAIKSSFTLPSRNVEALFTWDTSRPTLNLDNFNQIIEVDCQSDLVTLTFNSTESAEAAYKEWSGVEKLAVMLGHEHKCQGIENVTMLSVQSLLAPQNQFLTIDTQFLLYDDLMDSFELDITEPIENLVKRKTIESHPIGFNINFDARTQRVKNPFMKVGNYASCLNCYVTGDAVVSLHMISKKGIIREYKIKIIGDIKANLDLSFDSAVGSKMQNTRIPLFNVPLTPIDVPGIFSFGPGIKLDTAMSFNLNDQPDLKLGFSFVKRFEYVVEGRMFQKPNTSYSELPSFFPHAPQQTERLAFGVSAHLIPGIHMGLNVAQKPVMSFGIDLDTAMGIKGGQGVNPEKCADKYGISLTSQNSVHASLVLAGKRVPFSNPPKPIWTSKGGPISCTFCDRCFLV